MDSAVGLWVNGLPFMGVIGYHAGNVGVKEGMFMLMNCREICTLSLIVFFPRDCIWFKLRRAKEPFLFILKCFQGFCEPWFMAVRRNSDNRNMLIG